MTDSADNLVNDIKNWSLESHEGVEHFFTMLDRAKPPAGGQSDYEAQNESFNDDLFELWKFGIRDSARLFSIAAQFGAAAQQKSTQ